MRFALSVPPFTAPADVLGLARTAEANGWDGFFLWDHLRWDDRVEVHDPWVLLGAIATATSRMRIGTMVTPLSRRRPAVVAKHLVTLDHLSGGRATLGVGLGDPPDLDFSDFGDEPSYAVRAAVVQLIPFISQTSSSSMCPLYTCIPRAAGRRTRANSTGASGGIHLAPSSAAAE